MDSANMILTGPVPEPQLLRAAADGKKDAKLEQAAKDFESVFITKILEQMKQTIPDSGLLTDGAGEQMEGLFWLYLARDVADKGGFGLAKQVYQQLAQGQGK